MNALALFVFGGAITTWSLTLTIGKTHSMGMEVVANVERLIEMREDKMMGIWADRIEKLAMKMPPPNAYTPEFMMLAHQMRTQPLPVSNPPDQMMEALKPLVDELVAAMGAPKPDMREDQITKREKSAMWAIYRHVLPSASEGATDRAALTAAEQSSAASKAKHIGQAIIEASRELFEDEDQMFNKLGRVAFDAMKEPSPAKGGK